MNKQINEDLEDLFAFAPPEVLRKSVNNLFYSFIISEKTLPEDYKSTAEDILLLILFLEKVEKHLNTQKLIKQK